MKPANIAEIMKFPVELVKMLISNGYLQEHADGDYYQDAPDLLKAEIEKTLAVCKTVKDLANDHGLSERTMQKRLKAGEVPAFKFNGKYFITPEDQIIDEPEAVLSGVFLLSYFDKYGKTRQGIFHIIENVLKIKIKQALTGKQKPVRWIDENDKAILERYLKTGEKPIDHKSADGEIWLLSFFAKQYNYTTNGIKYQIVKAGIKVHRANAGDQVRSVLFLDEDGKDQLEQVMEKRIET